MKKRRFMVSLFFSIGLIAPNATFAAPLAPTTMFKAAIHVTNHNTSEPRAFVKANTVYMPVWYVMNAINKAGIHTDWNGHDWKMVVQKGVKIDTSHIGHHTGKLRILLNGILVEQVDGIVAVDPSSGAPTTYMPIWYLMHTLTRAQMISDWNGKTWTLTPHASPSTPSTGGTPDTGSTGTGSTGQAGGSTPPSGSGTGTTSDGSGTGTTGTPPSIVVLPQPPLPMNEIAKVQLLSALLPVLGIQADATPPSPFDDIAATDPNWGFVNAAISHHLLIPDSPQHSGAYEGMTLQMAETLYANWLGITNLSYQPGGNLGAWGNAIGLNLQNESADTELSPADEEALLRQIAEFQQGYVQNGGIYHVIYPPRDERGTTFAGAVDPGSGQPYFSSPSDATQAITLTYQFFDQTSFQVEGSSLLVAIPSPVNTNWFIYAASAGQIQYSIDNGSSWTNTNAFDSRQLAGPTATQPTQILLKMNVADGVSMSFNQLLPSFGETVSLGQITISGANGQVTVVRNSLNM